MWKMKWKSTIILFTQGNRDENLFTCLFHISFCQLHSDNELWVFSTLVYTVQRVILCLFIPSSLG